MNTRWRMERWLLATVVGAVIWPIGIAAFAFEISDGVDLSWSNLAGRGDLLLIAGGIAAQALIPLMAPISSPDDELETKRQRAMWMALSIVVFAIAGWSARIADIEKKPSLLSDNPPWQLTWVGILFLVASISVGAVSISLARSVHD